MSLIVVESPLRGEDASEQQRNFRYLLWCLRALWEVNEHHGIASHLVCPWFLDDANQYERAAGIGWQWMWQSDVEHVFFGDLGMSNGMYMAASICTAFGVPSRQLLLSEYASNHWAAFKRGEWPPHTAGFSVATEVDP